TDTVPVVRVPWNDPPTIMKALDLGAYAIIVPLINTADEAAKAVAACRYPPVGMRSSGPVRAVHYGGADYLAKANDEIVVMAMIETKEGLANLDKICATPGLDAIYIGPSDLSFALGLAPRGDNPDPTHIATCDKIRDAAHKHNIKAVMHCASAAFAAGAGKRGFDMVMLTSDPASMIAGARQQLEDLKTAAAGVATRSAAGIVDESAPGTSDLARDRSRRGGAQRARRPSARRPGAQDLCGHQGRGLRLRRG